MLVSLVAYFSAIVVGRLEYQSYLDSSMSFIVILVVVKEIYNLGSTILQLCNNVGCKNISISINVELPIHSKSSFVGCLIVIHWHTQCTDEIKVA